MFSLPTEVICKAKMKFHSAPLLWPVWTLRSPCWLVLPYFRLCLLWDMLRERARVWFITLPAVFAQMPLGIVFGVLFFVLLGIAALTSAISLLEVVSAWLIDEKGWQRKKAAICMGLVIFIAGLPAGLGYNVLDGVHCPGLKTDLLDTYDWFANSIFLPLGGLLSAIFVGYIWGTKKAVDEANKGCTVFTIGKWWIILIRYVVLIVAIMAVGIYDTLSK